MGNLFKTKAIESTPSYLKYKLRYLPLKKLTDYDYETLSHFSDIESLEIKDIFDKFLKSHQDGSLDRGEFNLLTGFLRKEGKESIEKISDDIFRAMGFKYYEPAFISFREFLLMYTLSANKGDLRERLSYAFDLYDSRHRKGLQIDDVREIIFIVLELFRKANNTKNLVYESSDIFKHIPITQIVTRDDYFNGLISNKKLRDLMNPKNKII